MLMKEGREKATNSRGKVFFFVHVSNYHPRHNNMAIHRLLDSILPGANIL